MGPDLCRSLHKGLPGAFLDVHLMVTDPGKFVEAFAKAGAGNQTFHVEVHPPDELRRLAERVRSLGCTAGLAINPPTPVERILPLVPDFDLILVMSVNPGFSGQRFIGEVLAKTRAIRPLLRSDQRLEMDGGIDPGTAPATLEAGCDVLVAASAIFGVSATERPGVIGALRGPKARSAARTT
jgi:ribulose-phosphate 3-epimerase